jgi:2-haloacid dehalogenase
MSDSSLETKALVFDVFGTVVDWHGSVAREMRELAKAKGLRVNAAKFAKAWRAGYRPAMDRVRSGEAPFRKIDDIHRTILEEVLAKSKVTTLGEEEKAHLNLVWHRLKPWPDSVRGLKRLKSKFVIATLSNGNTGLLVDMAKFAGLPWDCIFSSDTFKHFKPDPEMYLGAADMLSLKPEEGDDGRCPQERPARGGAMRVEDRFRQAAARARPEQQHRPRVRGGLYVQRGRFCRPGRSAWLQVNS